MKNEEKLAITERIAQHSGVQEKLLSNNNYAGGISITGFQSEENNRDSNINSSFIYAAPNFFHFMNIPLLKECQKVWRLFSLFVDKGMLPM